MTWRNPTTREDIETALDVGELFIRSASGAYYQARRNGKTKVWKTRPNQFAIPVKYGFRSTMQINNGTWLGSLRVAASRQDAEGPQ